MSTESPTNTPNTTETIIPVKSRSRSPSPMKKTVIETRRAEQNRAAQRAFRQRKERYVKELEARVNSMADWPARMEQLEKENEQLKRRLHLLEEENNSNRKAIKLEAIQNPSSSPSIDTQNTPPQEQQSPQQTQHRQLQPKATGEKGKVLDDLVSILKTRHRPPIQYHQYQPPKN